MNAAGYGMPSLNRADFDAWPVAILNLIFSNLEKQIFSEGRGLLDAKEARYRTHKGEVRLARR